MESSSLFADSNSVSHFESAFRTHTEPPCRRSACFFRSSAHCDIDARSIPNSDDSEALRIGSLECSGNIFGTRHSVASGRAELEFWRRCNEAAPARRRRTVRRACLYWDNAAAEPASAVLPSFELRFLRRLRSNDRTLRAQKFKPQSPSIEARPDVDNVSFFIDC